MDSSFGVVAHIPGAIRERSSGQVFNHSIEHNAVAAHRNQMSIDIQRSNHSLVGVIEINRNQHTSNVIVMDRWQNSSPAEFLSSEIRENQAVTQDELIIPRQEFA